ncbi:MAG: hypothetical protein Q7K13_08260 [Polynucleobacter sp.]|uniref:hypothetical protein n=1 Tax=Polynucleobacter sp. TaxID=2029855 RepID=UPI002716F540|nr:hypothetical protein [Polynucleobacter sp.]MDO8714454.1 hypothetical protein [Polynucleobacter sp.]
MTEMDNKTRGAWLLSQSKSIDSFHNAGRLENIQYAGRAGRLYNLLRRNIQGMTTSTLDANAVTDICHANGIDRSIKEAAISKLKQEGRLDESVSGAISVLGATATGVLETTASIFDGCNPTKEEQAVLHLSERVANRPAERGEIEEYVSDTFKIASVQTSSLIDVCKSIAILDQAEDGGRAILFNNNTFRDGQYAKKAYYLLQSLTATEGASLKAVQELLRLRGAINDDEARKMLGVVLFNRLVGVGLFDRLEVSNSTEAVGYLTSPDSFQRYGRPFEDDPIDDAKALLASLTYGMTRSSSSRGNIRLPIALLRSLINGWEVGGENGVSAIGEDYRELEKRQVVQVIPKRYKRFTMKLLKKDVGELAMTILSGNTAAPEALLMDGSAARSFKGPGENRKTIREKHTLGDNQYITSALDRLRSGA